MDQVGGNRRSVRDDIDKRREPSSAKNGDESVATTRLLPPEQ